MRRSFDYARVVALRQFATKPGAGAMDVHGFLDDWRAHVHAEFRDAYRTAISDCPVLPPHAADERHLLVLATIERLLYEVRYELANRPELVTVPLTDLTALLAEQPAG
jgi:predicted trehalose synthase